MPSLWNTAVVPGASGMVWVFWAGHLPADDAWPAGRCARVDRCESEDRGRSGITPGRSYRSAHERATSAAGWTALEWARPTTALGLAAVCITGAPSA